MTKLASYTLAEDDRKNINHMANHFSSVDIKYFSAKTFTLLGYIDKNHISIPFFYFSILFKNFNESLKVVLLNIILILVKSTKLTTPGILKIKVFKTKVYDVITLVHDVTTNFYHLNHIIM